MDFTLKQARIMAGLTQDMLAKKLKVSRYTVHTFENNPRKCTIDYAQKFSIATNVSIDQIVFK